MKKNLLSVFVLAIGLNFASYAQSSGDYRTVASGNWGNSSVTTAIWEAFDGSNWVATSTPPSSVNSNTITVRSGHTVTLNATSSVKDLVVESGAILKSGLDASNAAAVRSLRLVGTLTNKGTVGGTSSTDRVSVEGYATTGTMTLTGTGTYYLNLIRCNGVVQNVSLVIDADIDMNSYIAGYYTSGSGTSNSTSQDDDEVNIIINQGKTVKGGTGSYLHFNGSSLGTDFFGKYTYTINGTLDFSTSTSTTAIVEHATKANKDVTVAVNGVWKLGAGGLRGIGSGSDLTPSNTVLNIGPSGIVDASLTTNFVFKNATTGEVGFFNITGNGVLKQNPAAGTGSNTTTAFIGSNNVYSPIVFTGASGIYTLNVQNAADNGKKVVKKQWTVTPPAGASNVNLAFGWLPADQANSFNASSPGIYRYSSPSWATVNPSGAVSGSGTAISPYLLSTEATSDFGTFMIGNEAPTGTPVVLPLDLISFKSKVLATAVKLSWVTADEDGVKGFVVERKLPEGIFEAIGSVDARNQKVSQEYSFTDYRANEGKNYYRLKLVDQDGKETYSNVIVGDLSAAISLKAYPNPATGHLINFTHSANAEDFEIFSSSGVRFLKGSTTAGETLTTINISKLTAGVYYARFGRHGSVISFIKQ